jgi:inner membrane protein
MLGRTHFFVGMAAALITLRPESLPVVVAGTGAAAIGGVISDIDSGTSTAHKEADKIVMAATLALGAVIIIEYNFHIGIYRRLLADSNIYRIITGSAAFLLLCVFGMRQPHRSFMHSLLALFLFSSCVGIIFPEVAPYFAIGYASHLIIDLLNRKREKILWPMKKGYSFNLCSSKGYVNKLMMAAGMFISAIYISTLPYVQEAYATMLAVLRLN